MATTLKSLISNKPYKGYSDEALQGGLGDVSSAIGDYLDALKETNAPDTGTWGEAITRYLPGTDLAWTANDVKDFAKDGSYGLAALTGALGALGLGTMKSTGKKLADVMKDEADRVVQSPKNVDVAKRFKTGDKQNLYRGSEAFGGINPQQLGIMRKNYLDKMEQGVGGRNWYDESSNDILRWTGGNNADADTMANMLAITSSSTPVGSNLMYANKGWNQNLVGDALDTGKYPTAMGNSIRSIISDPAASASGLKRSPFSAGLSVGWRGQDFANRATHDIHDARAWGIKDPKTGEDWSRGIGEAGHRFLDEQADYVTQKAIADNLGGVSDWTPYRAQAAAWIAQKAQKEGKPIAETAKHYGSFAPDYQGLITREWVPGTNTGHLPEIQSAPDAIKKEYSDALESIVTGRHGIDNLARESGALSDTVTPNIGFYEGDMNPGYISRINVGKAKGSQSLDPASMKVMDALAAAHGLLGTQKQVAHNFTGLGVPIGEAGAVRLTGGALDDMTLSKLAGDLTKIGADVPMRDPAGGARFLHFGSPEEKQTLAKLVKPVAKQYGLKPEFVAMDGNLMPMNAPEQWSAKPFIEAIDRSGAMAPKIDQAIRPMAGEVLSKVNELAGKHGWTQADFFRPMMEGLRDGGIPRLKELVAQGIVPVAVLSVLGGMAGQEPEGAI